MAIRKRVYPHLPEIKDVHTQSTIRLLWDKAYTSDATLQTATESLNAAQGTIEEQAAAIKALQARVSKISAPAGAPVTRSGTPVGGGGGGGGVDDQGQGNDGCMNCGSDGHPTGEPMSLRTVGLIVCGTALEYPALVAPCIDQATRDAAALELLERIIWHVNEYGFTCGRQQNPSGVISQDKITVNVDGDWWAYDIFQGVDFSVPIPMQMISVGPANYQVDGGISD